MPRLLFLACGLTNALFTLFHILLGLRIQVLPALDPGYRALMHAFNVGGLVMLAFLSVAFLAFASDLRTRLGRATILFGALVYLSRAAGELVFFPRVGVVVLALCIAAGGLHLLAFRASRE